MSALAAPLYAFVTEEGVARINGVITPTNVALLPQPNFIGASAPGTRIRSGPGTSGPALFVLTPTANQVIEVSPITLSDINTATVPQNTNLIELYTLGTEWVLAQAGFAGVGGQPGSVAVVDPAPLAVTPMGSLPANITVRQILPIRSDSRGLAYFLSGMSTLSKLTTDPATTLTGGFFTLSPVTGGPFIELIDE